MSIKTVTDGQSITYGRAPDGGSDRLRTLGDVAGAGLGVLAAAPWIPGSSDVKATRKLTAGVSSTRVTLVTPTAGKKVRILHAFLITESGTVTQFELYFGTGANIGTDVTKYILESLLDLIDLPSVQVGSLDGGGKAGAVDEVVSMRTAVDIAASGTFAILYREE